MDAFTIEPVQVATESGDENGMLVKRHGKLVAVLVRLEDLVHGKQCGFWFLEAGFGQATEPEQPVFEKIQDALAWIKTRYAASPRTNPAVF